MSFLEMLDVLNDDLVRKGKDPIAFDHDCREGICGSAACSSTARRTARPGITTCQLHMRKFKDGDTIHVEPWRSRIPGDQGPCDHRGAFDRIQAAGGFVSVNTSGNLVDGNAVPIPKDDADKAFDAATCIGCGACVATCPNSSAMLFVAAKVSQYRPAAPRPPRGQAPRPQHGGADGQGRLWQLQQHRCLRESNAPKASASHRADGVPGGDTKESQRLNPSPNPCIWRAFATRGEGVRWERSMRSKLPAKSTSRAALTTIFRYR
jgi:succinate dehydrogenase/fumarate reductase-like Fe-S protein